MSFARRFGLLLSLPLVCGLLLAQETPAPAPPALARPESKPDSAIRLDVVVSGKKGVHVPQLQAKDFTLYDNKVAQSITSFHEVGAGSSAPVEVVLAVDAVNSTITTLSYARQELDKFLLANGGKLDRPTSLALLSDQGVQAQGGSTLDGKLLAQSVDAIPSRLRIINRSQGFYGAQDRINLSLSSLSLLIDQQASRPGRKLIVFISPGWPLLSGPRIELSRRDQERIFASVVNLSTRLRQANITLYQVDPLGSNEGMERRFYYQNFTKGIVKPGQTDEGDLGLQVIATQTGGLVFNANNDVAGLIKQSIEDASDYYELTFAGSPGEHPNEYHQLDVKLAQPGYEVRTRRGYYAQPTMPDGPPPESKIVR